MNGIVKVMPRIRKDYIIKGSIIFIFVILLCFFIFDQAVRFMLPEYLEIHYYDDVYIHKMIPNSYTAYKGPARFERNNSDVLILKINSLGFRDYEFEKKKNENTTRIMVYGDSFMQASQSELEYIFAKQLENKLREESDKKIEVINAGVTGYGPDQIILRMENEISEFDIDIAVVSIFTGNDYGDNIRNKIFRLDEDGKLVKNNYYINPDLKFNRMVSIYFPSWKVINIAFNKIRDILYPDNTSLSFTSTPDDYLEVAANMNLDDCREFIKEGNNQINNVFWDRYDSDVVLYPDNYCTNYKIELMDKIIERMKNITDSNGIELLVLIIPTRHEIDDEIYLEMMNTSVHKRFDRSKLTDILEDISKKNNINYINLYPHFRKNNINNTFFWFNNVHWNYEGQEYAAELMKDKIIGEDLI